MIDDLIQKEIELFRQEALQVIDEYRRVKNQNDNISLEGYTDILVTKFSSSLHKIKDEAKREAVEEAKTELYRLDWIKILSNAIQGRPTSFYKGCDAIMEWRNASDQILGSMIQMAEDKGIFLSLKDKINSLKEDGGK